jgi:phosphoribosylanthranilate isomerase
MKVKICGITRPADAQAATEAGADALGFVFVRSSPRYIDPDRAAEIIAGLPPFVTPVGVVVNEPRARVLDLLARSRVRVLQFHGEELPADIAGFGVPVIKALRVGPGFDPASIVSYRADAVLLDAGDGDRRGGTGRTFPWELAAGAGRFARIILAGGLTPGNILEAAGIVRPYACDISSGVESAPGRKDPERLRALFRALHTMY